MAFADKKAAFAYVNEYQKEKYDRITVMAGKGGKGGGVGTRGGQVLQVLGPRKGS